MRRPLLILIAVSFASAPAHAEETSAWSQAFPATSRTGLSRAGATAGQVGAVWLEGNAALLSGLGILAFGEKTEYEPEATPKLARPANDAEAKLSAEEELRQKQARLRKLALGEDLKVLSAEEAEELRQLRNPTGASSAKVAKRLKPELVISKSEELLAPAEPVTIAGHNSHRGPVKGAAMYRALSVAALGTFVADGGLRLLALLQGREPGYSPAVNLSRELLKKAAKPVAPRGEQVAATSFSAE